MTAVMRPVPTADDIAGYLGFTYGADSDSRNALIDGRLPVTLNLAASYTHGRGFSDDMTRCRPDLWAVIVAACAREVSQEVPGEQRDEIGSSSTWNSGTGQLWLLREILAMRNYRLISQ